MSCCNPRTSARTNTVVAALLQAALALAFAGCKGEAPQQNPPPPRSTLSTEAQELRTRLPVETVPLKGSLWYRPVARCQFAEYISLGNKGSATNTTAITVKPLDNRLLLTKTTGKDVSTILTDQLGKLYDYNLIDSVTRQRSTPESFAKDARRWQAQARSTEAAVAPAAHMVKGVTWLPEFTARSATPGDTIAVLVGENNLVWARYVYRGAVSFKKSPGAVVDIVQTSDAQSKSGTVLIGFSIINLRTMLPLVHVFNAGQNYRLEQLECR